MINDNALQTFLYNNKTVRTVWLNGEIWLVLKDVCDVLELSTPTRVAERLDEDEVSLTHLIDSIGRSQEMTIINESGLYNVILRSDKPEAKKFKRWITHEVLPQIRKHGAYFPKEKTKESIGTNDMMISLLNTIKEKDAENERLRNKIEEDKPKVAFADALSASECSIPIGDFSKILHSNGINIGQNRMFERLREEGLLIKRKCTSHNSPTQKAMELGLFTVNESTILHPDGSIALSRSTKITPKGQQYLVDMFTDKKADEKLSPNANANQVCINFFIMN
jgi:anti-repressor protein